MVGDGRQERDCALAKKVKIRAVLVNMFGPLRQCLLRLGSRCFLPPSDCNAKYTST